VRPVLTACGKAWRGWWSCREDGKCMCKIPQTCNCSEKHVCLNLGLEPPREGLHHTVVHDTVRAPAAMEHCKMVNFV
jgi:hypothetical protein